MQNNIRDIIKPINYTSFHNTKQKITKGLKNSQYNCFKRKRNIILKINIHNII